jgi:hypothetical protein
MLTEHDVTYLCLRLGLKPEQPAAKALRLTYEKGHPFGAAARAYKIPVHKMEQVWRQAEQLRAGFTVTDAEAAGLTANELLGYQRRREAQAWLSGDAQRDALRAAGLTDAQIDAALAVK